MEVSRALVCVIRQEVAQVFGKRPIFGADDPFLVSPLLLIGRVRAQRLLSLKGDEKERQEGRVALIKAPREGDGRRHLSTREVVRVRGFQGQSTGTAVVAVSPIVVGTPPPASISVRLIRARLAGLAKAPERDGRSPDCLSS